MPTPQRMIDYARRFIGTTYYWPISPAPQQGNDDPILGFDCSGFVSECLRREGFLGPYDRLNTTGIYEKFAGKVVWAKGSTIPMLPKAGDLLLYGSSLKDLYHSAICCDEESIIEAGGGARGTDTPVEAAAVNAFIRERPIKNRLSELQVIIRLY